MGIFTLNIVLFFLLVLNSKGIRFYKKQVLYILYVQNAHQ